MSRDITVTLFCDQPNCPATTTYGVVPDEQGNATAAGWHILVTHDGSEEDYCREHWIELGFDPKDEVECE